MGKVPHSRNFAITADLINVRGQSLDPSFVITKEREQGQLVSPYVTSSVAPNGSKNQGSARTWSLRRPDIASGGGILRSIEANVLRNRSLSIKAILFHLQVAENCTSVRASNSILY
jgi:hypothetical protein